MKNTKKFAAMIAALTLSACSVAPMFSFADNTVTITLPATSENYGVEHTYNIYQIFTGTYKAGTAADGNNPATPESLEGLTWGSSSGKTGAVDPNDAAYKALIGTGDNRDKIKNFIDTLTLDAEVATVKSESGTATVEDLPDGYYYIVDVTSDGLNGTGTVEGTDKDKYDAKSAIMVQIIGGSSTTVNVKKSRPSINKQISDNDDGVTLGDNNGWGETADHAIDETFQFKLTATIPADEDLKAYETYYFEFCDKFSEGVTFEKIESLTIDGSVADQSKWTMPENAVDVNSTHGFNVKTADIKSQIGENWGTKEITVELIYSAHLNENAKFFSSDKTGGKDEVENNYVSLKYSNNPEEEGDGTENTGETPKDYVWGFTYAVDNTKVDATDTTKKLAGAKFKLKKDETDISVKKVTDTEASGTEGEPGYTPEVYHYVVCKSDDAGKATEIISSADGTFNIVGLDAGTYILTEIEAPTGYTLPANPNTKFTIVATHEEVGAGTQAELKLENGVTPSNTIENSFSSSLPSTGGIGTTIFYLGGGAMVAVAGVFLITKKRMGKSEN